MVWYGMTWGDIISYDVVWYGLCKGEHMGVHWDMDWQMKDAVISKKDEDWTCRESVSNSRGCFNGWNEQVETCWNRQLEGFKQQTSDQNFTQESSSPSLPCRSIGIDKPRSWNKQWLLKPQEVASPPVTSSDIKWHQGFAVHSVGCWESERGPQRWSQWSKPKYSRLKRPESGQLTAVRGRIFEKII